MYIKKELTKSVAQRLFWINSWHSFRPDHSFIPVNSYLPKPNLGNSFWKVDEQPQSYRWQVR